jgi:hypothetical protein
MGPPNNQPNFCASGILEEFAAGDLRIAVKVFFAFRKSSADVSPHFVFWQDRSPARRFDRNPLRKRTGFPSFAGPRTR